MSEPWNIEVAWKAGFKAVEFSGWIELPPNVSVSQFIREVHAIYDKHVAVGQTRFKDQ